MDAIMVLLGFQEPPAQAVRCADDPQLCQMEVASLSIASSDWSVLGGQVRSDKHMSGDKQTSVANTLSKKLGLRLSAAEAAHSRAKLMRGAGRGSVIARHVGLDTLPSHPRVSNEDM